MERTSYYTLYVTYDYVPSTESEQGRVDIVAASRASAQQVVNEAREEIDLDFPGAGVCGIIDMSAGRTLFDGTDGEILR